jgi:hypothetical protein
VAHFDDEQPSGIEVLRRFGDDRLHEIEAISSAGERERRLFPILGGQRPHHGVAHVGRIGDNHVVSPLSEF